MTRSLFRIFAYLFLGAFLISTAKAGEMVEGDTNDTMLFQGQVGSGAYDLNYQIYVGTLFFGQGNMFEPFALPYLAPGQQVTGASISFYLESSSSPGYNVQLYGLNRVSATSDAGLASDWYEGTSDTANTLLDATFATPSTPANTACSYAGGNLVSFIQNQYANAAFSGQDLSKTRYVFFRLSPDATSTGLNSYTFASARNPNRTYHPVLALTISNGITNVAGRLQFSFNLPQASTTSAGVYDASSGKLLRTIWSNQQYQAGTNYGEWDGKDDNGNALPTGTNYQIKLIYHNVQYVWEGMVGNSSANQSGPSVYRPFGKIHDMAVEGNTAYYAAGYNELANPFSSFAVGNPQVCLPINFGYNFSDCFSNFYYMCGDATKTYWAKVSGGIDAIDTYVVAMNNSNNTFYKFPQGGNPQVDPYQAGAYVGCVDFDQSPNQANPATGLAVQKSGNALFVSHGNLNLVRVFDKVQGNLLGTISVTNPGRMATTANGDVWIISNASTPVVQRYSFANGSGTLKQTLSGVGNPVGVGVSADDSLVLVADGGSSQQIKAFNNSTGTAAWTYGNAGGMVVNGPNVTNNTFQFIAQLTQYNALTPEAFIAFQPDNTFWIEDAGNGRYMHFSINGTTLNFIEQISFVDVSYKVTVDPNNPTQVFNTFYQYAVNYNLPLGGTNGSWTLAKNWEWGLPYDSTHSYFGFADGFSNVVTLSNGRTYGQALNFTTQYWDLYELPATGQARYTGTSFQSVWTTGNITLPSTPRIYEDGTLRYNYTNGGNTSLSFYSEPLTGFDSNNNPMWGSPRTLGTIGLTAGSSPIPWGAFPMRTEITSSNILVDFDAYQGDSGYHLGGFAAGSSVWSWLASPSLPSSYGGWFPQDGKFDDGNGTQYAGSHVMALGRNIVYSYIGELWHGGEASQWVNFLDNGLMVGRFGAYSNATESYFGAVDGYTGNADSPALVYGPNGSSGSAYLYTNDESDHGGACRWRIDGLNSISEMDGTGTVGSTTALVAASGNPVTTTPPVVIPVITSATSASGTTGSAFSYTITASNSPTSFNAAGLPAGLSINTSSGIISGTPTATGTSNVTLGATNGGGTGTATLVLTIGSSAPTVSAPVLTSAATATATAGSSFSYSITANNSPTSYGASGLPSGLSVNANTGIISGTPASAGTSSVTLTATNAGGTGSETLALTVNAATPTVSVPAITSAASATATVGSSFSYSITASNSPASYGATGLPSGLSINSFTGIISGTPSSAGTSNVTLTATNSGGTGNETMVLTVNAATPTVILPVLTSAATATATMGSSFSYTITANNGPSSFSAAGLPSGLSVDSNSGIISGNPSASGTFAVTVGASNSAGTGTQGLSLTVNAASTPAGVPVITSPLTVNAVLGAQFNYQITGTNSPTKYDAPGLPADLMIDTTTGAIYNASTTLGTYHITISATNASGTGTAVLTINAVLNAPTAPTSAPVLSSPSTATATVGSSFSFGISASNSPASYGANGLPSGLTMNSTSGIISGTPSSAGTANVTLSATNSVGTGTENLVLTVNPAAPTIPAPVLTSATTATATVGTNFSYNITANNSPYSYGATGLPSGLTINSVTGVVSGTPSSAGTVNVILTATNNGGTGSETLVLTVNAPAPVVPAPVITSAATATGTAGSNFSYAIMASNSPTSYGATGLPSGLSINSVTGIISGTPSSAGTSNLTVTATNAGGTGSEAVVLTVNTPPPTIIAPVVTSAPTATATTGSAFSYAITASNTPTSYGATGLPPGLSVDSNSGIISGTPSSAGTSNITLTAANSGGTGSQTLVLTVNPPAPVLASAATATATVGSNFTYTITASNNPTGYGATGLPAGLSVDPKTGIISGTPTSASTSNVTLTATNAGGTGTEAMVLTVSTPAPTVIAPVVTSAAAATATAGSSFSYAITANNTPTSYGATGLPSGLLVDSNTGIITGTPSSVGTANVTLTATNTGGTGSEVMVLTVNAPPPTVVAPVVTSAATATATAGSSFSYTITASNNPASYGATGLPSGLSVDPTSGIISGTPLSAGTTNITLTATNTGGTGSEVLVLTVNAPAPTVIAPVVTSAATATATVGSTFSYTVTASNSPASFGAAGLPSGLSIDTGSGIVSGTPTASGTFPVTLSATNSGGTGTQTLTLTVNAAAVVPTGTPVITSPLNATAVLGAPFSYTITASNSPTSYNAPGLPANLMINTATGAIYSVSSTVGTYHVTISATNSVGTGTATLTLNALQTAPPTTPTTPTSPTTPTPPTGTTPSTVTFAAWEAQNFTTTQLADSTVTGPAADPYGSGVPNLLAYAFQLNPATARPTDLPTPVNNGGHLSITYTVPPAVTDITYVVEVSSDLMTWNSGATVSQVVSSVTGTNGTTITMQDTLPTTTVKHFMRLRVVQNP